MVRSYMRYDVKIKENESLVIKIERTIEGGLVCHIQLARIEIGLVGVKFRFGAENVIIVHSGNATIIATGGSMVAHFTYDEEYEEELLKAAAFLNYFLKGRPDIGSFIYAS